MPNEKNEIVNLVDLKLYPLEAVYAAAYYFLDKAYVRLGRGLGSNVRVILKGKKQLTEKQLNDLADEFLNELLSCSLRDKISKNNKKIREYIIIKALTSALPEETNKLQDDVPWIKKNNKKEEFIKKPIIKDPLGILAPWQEKTKKTKRAKKTK
jgi:His-Xaa-Ser system protein HxsD